MSDLVIHRARWSASRVPSVLLGDRFRVVNRERELFNTMAELDARAAALPKARNWLNYPYFMFARYPHLRPSNNDRTFWQKLEEWDNRIESDSKAARTLADLKPDLRKELASLLVDIIAELEVYRKKVSRTPRTFIAEGECFCANAKKLDANLKTCATTPVAWTDCWPVTTRKPRGVA
jgi:hypothetical protein